MARSVSGFIQARMTSLGMPFFVIWPKNIGISRIQCHTSVRRMTASAPGTLAAMAARRPGSPGGFLKGLARCKNQPLDALDAPIGNHDRGGAPIVKAQRHVC